MNNPKTHSNDAANVARQQTLNRQQTMAGLALLAVAVVILFILPEYLSSPFDVMVMGFGSATLMTIYLHMYPESLRSRGGSLLTAFCLVAAMWLLAVVVMVVSLVG